MNFPLVLVPELTEAQRQRYLQHMDSARTGWHRRFTESIWRRHQHSSNAQQSGWNSPEDQRRRLIHFYDEYGLDGNSFVLRNSYLWINLTLPNQSIADYRALLVQNLRAGGWERTRSNAASEFWRRGALNATAKVYPLHPEDERRGVAFPSHYRNLEIAVWTEGYQYPATLHQRPWRWFYEVGLRKIVPRGNPQLIEPEEVVQYFPAQVELGCGPSTEAGIPHLSTLHRIYSVSKSDFSCVFEAADDLVFQVFASPEEKYREMCDIYRACVVAEATPFYKALHELSRHGHLVGPVITNNFDCLCADVGLEEVSLRRYDTEPYFPMAHRGEYPSVSFDPGAQSLLVVGVHADRRLAQLRARERGLKIIYIDPERYLAPDGNPIPYPVESPQDQDGLVRMTAGEAMPRIYQTAMGQPLPTVSEPVTTRREELAAIAGHQQRP